MNNKVNSVSLVYDNRSAILVMAREDWLFGRHNTSNINIDEYAISNLAVLQPQHLYN